MVEHENDVCNVKYPETDDIPMTAPMDTIEIFDYIVRKGPISYREIKENVSFMSPDDVWDAIKALDDSGFIFETRGRVKEFGTSRPVYYVPPQED